MEDKKYCTKCQHNKALDAFEEGYETCTKCTKCREKGRKRYYRKWGYKEIKKEYIQNNPGKVKETQK